MKLHLAHILLKQKYEADDVLRLLAEGLSFESLARKFSLCSSSSNGGDLGEVELRRFDSDFAEAAEQLKVGELSPIVRTRFGYHLIKRIR